MLSTHTQGGLSGTLRAPRLRGRFSVDRGAAARVLAAADARREGFYAAARILSGEGITMRGVAGKPMKGREACDKGEVLADSFFFNQGCWTSTVEESSSSA